MIREPDRWYPGSFTKNFSWGENDGLRRLHASINEIFGGRLEAVPRASAIERLESKGYVWHIPLNFFLANQITDGESWIVVDELVFQALTFPHSPAFDKIALVAFINSYVGHWQGARPWQETPAPWANNYVRSVFARGSDWGGSIRADDIENFVISSGKYRAEGARKLATNLSYLFKVAKIDELANKAITRWWVDALFLILDRSLLETSVDLKPSSLQQIAIRAGFIDISGPRTRNRELALQPLTTLYWACGGPHRWSKEAVEERQRTLLPEISWFANSDDPFYAIYQRDPNIIKVVPRVCAMLAKSLADFDELDPDELLDWDPLIYIRNKTRDALNQLKQSGVRPTMSADELLKITREG